VAVGVWLKGESYKMDEGSGVNLTTISQEDQEQWRNHSYILTNTTQEDDIINHSGVQAIFYVIYSTIFVLGIFGNVLVCFVVGRNKAMQTVTNFFITNLALADILLCALAVPFTPLYTFLEEWIFGRVLCHLVPYAQGVSVYISTLTLTSIAIDRFFVIIYPFKPRMRLTTCLLIITSIWIFALLATLPYGIFLHFEMDNGKYTCREDWPTEHLRHVFSGCTTTVQFILPFIIILFCYVKVSIKLADRAKAKPGSKNSKKEALERERKRRTNRMLIAMVMIFGICWLPINVVNLLNDVYMGAGDWKFYNLCFFLSHAIAMSSCCYNPWLYAWLNENFRKEFKQVLPCFSTPLGNRGSRRFMSQRTCNGNETVQETLIPIGVVHVQQHPSGNEPGKGVPPPSPNMGILETIDEQGSESQQTPVLNVNYDQVTATYFSTTNQVEVHIPFVQSPKSESQEAGSEGRSSAPNSGQMLPTVVAVPPGASRTAEKACISEDDFPLIP
jgi:neuropeptide Y receptor